MSTQAQVFQNALGISTGDIVRTSWGTGPYTVTRIDGPRTWRTGMDIVIYPVPVVDLSVRYMGAREQHLQGAVNMVYRVSDKYYTLGGHKAEVFIEHVTGGPVQLGMFVPLDPDPLAYPFQADVDYDAGLNRIWQCLNCNADFNHGDGSRFDFGDCPACDRTHITMRVIKVRIGDNPYLLATS